MGKIIYIRLYNEKGGLNMYKTLPEQYLIYGTMGLGGSSWNPEDELTKEDIQDGINALVTAYESGIQFFDLADIYKSGKSELVFGHFLKENPSLRNEIIVQSKVGIQLAGGGLGPRYNFSYEHIIHSVNNILKRIGSDYLDILLLHRPDPLLERDDIKKAMDYLFDSGKIRALGVSNMDYHQIQLLEAYTDRKIIVNQLELSLLKTDFVSSAIGFNNSKGKNLDFTLGTIEHSILNHISLQSWGPLARGIYSGAPLYDKTPESVINTKNVITRMAKEHNVSNDGIVLAWLLKHPAKIKPIIGTKNPERIRKAMDAFKVTLTREEWYELFDASRGVSIP